MIRAFQTLSPSERDQLFDLVQNHDPALFPTLEKMIRVYGGIVYDRGESQFSCWEMGRIRGAIALVTKEIEIKAEAFVHGVFIDETAAFEGLLRRALEYLPRKPLNVKLGLPPEETKLGEIAHRQGFREAYSLLELTYGGHSFSQTKFLRFDALKKKNGKLFQGASNGAFLHSPNGAQLSEEEIDELIVNNEGQELMGIAFSGERAVGVYQLSLKDGIGWIDTIGIHPDHQGQGFGKAMLEHCLNCLEARGASEIKLTVISSNENAVRLYRQHGFARERVLSRWLEKALP
jgi:GNAT superfamily N-acetyltransferase